jgi:hypothetical protein
MQITKEKALQKLRELQAAETPVLFGVRLAGWPLMAASAHGLIEEVSAVDKISAEKVTVRGNAGVLTLFLDDTVCYEISGHYPLRRNPEDSLLDLDPYFRSWTRVRSLTFRTEYGEANVVFEAKKH